MPNEAPIQVKTKLKIFSGLPSLVLYFCVFFILLVFFMLSSNFVPLRGIEVNLPRTGGRLTYTSRNFVVTIDKERVIIRCDVRAPLTAVAEVLSVAEELNVNALFMSAGPPRGRTASFTEPES